MQTPVHSVPVQIIVLNSLCFLDGIDGLVRNTQDSEDKLTERIPPGVMQPVVFLEARSAASW